MKKFKKAYPCFLFASLLALVGCGTTPNSSSSGNATSNEEVSSVVSSEEVEYYSEVYSNPMNVIGTSGGYYNQEIADPTVVRGDDGYFYCFATDQRVLRSEDGVNWELHSQQIIPTPTWGNEVYNDNSISFHIWAPDCVKIGDYWIYYYSLSAWGKPAGIGYAIAEEIGGPYTDMGKLFSGDEIGIKNCIDPQVFEDDGHVYMVVGSFQGLYVLELTEDGMECLGGIEQQKADKVLIAGYDGGWDGATYEGSYIIKKDGYYYYFGSSGTCCAGKDSTYNVRVARSKDVFGPYIDSSGKRLLDSRGPINNGDLVLWAGSSADKQVVGPGHNSIFIDDAGDYWIYYHAFSSADNFATRHLFLDKLSWNEKGMPYVSYYDYEEDKEVKFKPSFEVELDGPRLLF